MAHLFRRQLLIGSVLILLNVKGQAKKQITLTLPLAIEPPKFKLFGRVVMIDGSFRKGSQIFTVTDLSFVNNFTSAMETLEQVWHYELSEVYGVSNPAILRKVDVSPNVIHEGYLAKVVS